jgi:hypothetical protein
MTLKVLAFRNRNVAVPENNHDLMIKAVYIVESGQDCSVSAIHRLFAGYRVPLLYA